MISSQLQPNRYRHTSRYRIRLSSEDHNIQLAALQLESTKMCVGHPKRHPCQHTSVTYNHCVAAHFDRATRTTTPCHNTTYAAPVDSDSKCTNQLCYFEELGGSWTCCKCSNGPNFVGWCTFDRPRTEMNAITQQMEQVTRCDHCCCWNCTPYRGLPLQFEFPSTGTLR